MASGEIEMNQIDPHAWSQAFIEAFKGGGWVVPALIALVIICRWPPWRKGQKD